MSAGFPCLDLAHWRGTRETLRSYAELLAQVRSACAPPRKHGWHRTLVTTARGLSTTPLPAGTHAVEIVLDMSGHQIVIADSLGGSTEIPLLGQTAGELCRTLLQALYLAGLELALEDSAAREVTPHHYDNLSAEHYWRALSRIDLSLKRLQGELPGECSPVHFLAQPFELVLDWLGMGWRQDTLMELEGQSPPALRWGFSAGDRTIAQPHCYAAYSRLVNASLDEDLPSSAFWERSRDCRLALPYAALEQSDDPVKTLDTFLRVSRKLIPDTRTN